MKRLMMIAATTALLLGCGGKKDKGNKDDETPKPVAASVADAGAPAQPAPDPNAIKEEDDVPTQADFEEEAATEITKDNVEKEVKKLEDDLPAE